jgi:hypothetical protein
MNHRLLRRPRTFAIAVECSAMQGYAKQRSYIFVYTWPSINGCESRLTVMLRTESRNLRHKPLRKATHKWQEVTVFLR